MPTLIRRPLNIAGLARRLRRDRSGLAMMEFAFTLPVVMAMGGWGVELSFLALTNLRVSQAAVNLADNASRVGMATSNNITQLREVDINDVLQGVKLENAGIKLTQFGRITLSSLEMRQQAQDSAPVQRLHWQRCLGAMSGAGYDSNYGAGMDAADGTTADTLASHPNEGVTKANGLGPSGKEVKAPNDGGVMFVEVGYRYKPLFGSLFVSPQVIRYEQSFVVRDNRDFTKIWNPNPAATLSTCDKYTV